VNLSRRAWVVILALLVSGGAIWLAVYQRARIAAASPAGMLRRLPAQDAAILFLDFDTLRAGGIVNLLSQSKAAEEPEYQAFVRASGFDYRSDLDRAAVAFSNEGAFFVVKGRFDWKKLAAYAAAQGGTCEKRFCRMPGSTPERRISFYPLQSNLMALAVSSDSAAASRLENPPGNAIQPLEQQRDPVWLSIPAGNLKSSNQLPAGTRLFAAALASADKILFSLGPQGRQFEAKLAVTCRTSEEAAALAAQLQRTTSLLRDMIARENQKPNAKDLSGVLTAGVFEQAGRRVVGRWPLPPVFIESLAGGTL
jgi:hypothetical protein